MVLKEFSSNCRNFLAGRSGGCEPVRLSTILRDLGLSDTESTHSLGMEATEYDDVAWAPPAELAPPPPPNPPPSIKVVVSQPQKHGDGSTAFISYLVSTRTAIESYTAPEMSCRRRFQDFVWLHRAVNEEFPAVVLPPLPGKHRMRGY